MGGKRPYRVWWQGVGCVGLLLLGLLLYRQWPVASAKDVKSSAATRMLLESCLSSDETGIRAVRRTLEISALTRISSATVAIGRSIERTAAAGMFVSLCEIVRPRRNRAR